MLGCGYALAVETASLGTLHFRRAADADTPAYTSLLHAAPSPAAEAGIQLDVPYISQLPELRNGCEITATAMLLNYYGFAADKCTLADDYLPKLYPYNAADPEEGYMGDPYTVWGYYCMTGPIVTAINDYFTAQAVPLWQAVDISGASMAELQSYITRGFPVQAWVTIDFAEPAYDDAFYLPNGTLPYANLHCVVVTGMTETTFTINDPLEGSYTVPQETFEAVYTALGNRAVILQKERE